MRHLFVPFIFASVFVCCFFTSTAQTNAIAYQAVARNANGNLLQNKIISLRFTIHHGTANGPAVYQEVHTVTTNLLGLFTANIGGGTPTSGDFAFVDWGSGSKNTQKKKKTTTNKKKKNKRTNQKHSVPYALYAANCGTPGYWALQGSDMYSTAAGNVGIGTSSPGQKLEVAGSIKSDGLIADHGLVINNLNTGDASLTGGSIRFGGISAGEGISSARTGPVNVNGLDFYTGYANRLA